MKPRLVAWLRDLLPRNHSGPAVARLFHYRTETVGSLKDGLAAAGIEVRR